MNEFLVILAGVLLRIAIPALILLGLAMLLNHLDSRWKQEAASQDREVRVAQTPCWETRACSAGQKAVCPARNSQEACWQIFRKENGDFDPSCLTCDVFLNGVDPLPAAVTGH